MFQNILLWVILFWGIIGIISAFLVTTKTLLEGFMFKVLPFFGGSACVLYFLLVGGLIK